MCGGRVVSEQQRKNEAFCIHLVKAVENATMCFAIIYCGKQGEREKEKGETGREKERERGIILGKRNRNFSTLSFLCDDRN